MTNNPDRPNRMEKAANDMLSRFTATGACASGWIGCTILLLWFLASTHVHAQDTCTEFSETIRMLYHARGQDLETVWEDLVIHHRIPLTCGDSVAFLYRGPAQAVSWIGDFNGWGYDKKFDCTGKRIPTTDVWILKTTLPADARLDYKILLNEKDWILDPVNPANQWSGVGGGSINSELRMPHWQADSIALFPLPGVCRGRVTKDLLFNGREPGYQITYSIYYPPGYTPANAYTILYVTDGYEYMHERMGNMVTILDNLIFLGKIRPVIAVFIDHREPVNRSVNRRMTELGMNERYANFITREFVPQVEADLHVAAYPYSRVVIGNSAGGLFATWLGFSHPDLFPLLGVQSPSFSFQPRIYSFVQHAPALPARLYMTSGSIHDSAEPVSKMKEILEKRSCTFECKQVNQGHSWGNWRDLVDDMLVYLLQ